MSTSLIKPQLVLRKVPTSIPDDTQHRVVATGQLDLRAAGDSDTGAFEGYAVLWDVTDSYGTRFAPGCFSAGGLDEDLYALLAMHDPTQVIGTFRAREDERGLYITGSWDDTSSGRDARARAKSGSAPGLSVGFVPLMVDPNDENRYTQTRLVEVSQITARMAAVPGAEFAGVRQQQHDDTTQRDDAGAATVAAAILSLSAVRSLRRR